MLASKPNLLARLHYVLTAVLVAFILILVDENTPSRLGFLVRGGYREIVTSPLSFYAQPFSPSFDPAKRAYATTLYSESYLPGALLLGHSLRQHGMLNRNVAQHMLLLHIPGRLSDETLELLRGVGWQTVEVDMIPAPKGKSPSPNYEDQYTKLRLFELEKFEQVFYIDADALVVKPFPEIWSFPAPFAASRDVRIGSYNMWLPTINAGTFLIKPNHRVLDDMLKVAPSLDYEHYYAEQALLNRYWARDLTFYPYIYNGQLDMKRGLPEVWKAFRHDMRIIHYTGTKPWWCGYDVDQPEERRVWIRDWEEMVAMRAKEDNPLPDHLQRLTASGFCVDRSFEEH
ncbi:hypothetical protein FRC16_005662 [Serendipita sp. 398]|nr:hypothetical protein FRC16_005662 [Serendipita sp. 398]KAG8808127.1 hypothetical protein FRC18_005188 [Serendipita sp. 400]